MRQNCKPGRRGRFCVVGFDGRADVFETWGVLLVGRNFSVGCHQHRSKQQCHGDEGISFWRHKQLPKEQDNGRGPALVTLQKIFKLIMAINSSSFWPWEPVPNSGKGEEKTLRVLLYMIPGSCCWDERGPSSTESHGQDGGEKLQHSWTSWCSSALLPKACPYLHHWCSEASSCVCTLESQSFRWITTLVQFSTKLIFTALLFIIPSASPSFLLGQLVYCGFFSLEQTCEVAIPFVWR